MANGAFSLCDQLTTRSSMGNGAFSLRLMMGLRNSLVRKRMMIQMRPMMSGATLVVVILENKSMYV